MSPWDDDVEGPGAGDRVDEGIDGVHAGSVNGVNGGSGGLGLGLDELDELADLAPLPDPVHGAAGDVTTEGLLRRMHDVVNSAKSMPLSASVLVSRDELLDMIGQALDRLPDELREARWLLKEREQFLADRAREAEALMEDVRAQAERMVSRTEIVRQANQGAQRILDDANEESRRMRHETEDYCDQKLAGMEIVLERIMRTVRTGRQKLQAVAPVVAPAHARGAVPGGAAGDPASGAGEGGDGDGFFDQDLA